jgi:hypothetical protein
MASWCIDGVQADRRSASKGTAAMSRAVSLRQLLYTLSHYELHARRWAKSVQKNHGRRPTTLFNTSIMI